VTATTTVAVFVGTRADLGPLSPVIEALHGAPDIGLRLLTGVMYDADDLAAALPRVATVEHWRERVTRLADPMTQVSVTAQLEQGAVLARAAGRALAAVGADVLVVLGDRWELLYVVPPAFLLGVPIVHLHGGEVTEGAVDERVRHAVSKLADQHCAASPDAASRLLQMGEPPSRVHVTGAPGLDRLASAAPLDDSALAALVGLDAVQRPVALFTYHPPTARADAPVGRWAREAAEATLAVCGTVVATYPGMDEGRDEIIASLRGLAAEQPSRFRFVEALGRDYPGVLGAVDVVVGNSSSGVIEAATLHTPAVNIGDRQQGRLRGDNVLDCAEGRAPVEDAVRTVLGSEWLARTAAADNPYGTGDASHRILDIVRGATSAGRVKPFVDLAGRPELTEHDPDDLDPDDPTQTDPRGEK
jgi:UDP-N-acetylglucosamine 2-epimerase (non-hydrolysing)